MLWLILGGVVVVVVVALIFLRSPQTPVTPQATAPSPRTRPKAKPAAAVAEAPPESPATSVAPKTQASPSSPPPAETASASTSSIPPSPRLPRLPRLHSSDADEPEENTALTLLTPRALAPDLPAATIHTHTKDAEIDEPSGLHSLILVTAVAHTDKGKKRKHNEDSYRVLDDQSVFLVADGMGGHQAGEVASTMAAQAIEKAFVSGSFPGAPDTTLPRRADELRQAVCVANEAIFLRSQEESSLHGMGTTVVAARFSPTKRRAYIAHVGDSRCYRVRQGEIKQLTTDHTLRAATGLGGSLGERLTRALGIERDVIVDLQLDSPQPHDLYVLCSDGLTKMVPDNEIRDLLVSNTDLQSSAQALIDAANERGGSDNITAVVIRIDPFVLS